MCSNGYMHDCLHLCSLILMHRNSRLYMCPLSTWKFVSRLGDSLGDIYVQHLRLEPALLYDLTARRPVVTQHDLCRAYLLIPTLNHPSCALLVGAHLLESIMSVDSLQKSDSRQPCG